MRGGIVGAQVSLDFHDAGRERSAAFAPNENFAQQIGTDESGMVIGDDSEEPAELMTSIEDLNLSARTTNALVNNDIHTIKDLLSLSEAELRDLKGFGNKALDEV